MVRDLHLAATPVPIDFQGRMEEKPVHSTCRSEAIVCGGTLQGMSTLPDMSSKRMSQCALRYLGSSQGPGRERNLCGVLRSIARKLRTWV